MDFRYKYGYGWDEEDYRSEEEIEEEMYRMISLAENGYFEEEPSNGFYSKVVGVTQGNRQNLIMSLHKGDKLILVRETYNEYDSKAIAVYSNNQKIGYIPKETVSRLACEIDNGVKFDCMVAKVTGGDGLRYGVNIYIERVKDYVKQRHTLLDMDRLIDNEGLIDIQYSNELLINICSKNVHENIDWDNAYIQIELVIKEFSKVFIRYHNEIKAKGYWLIFLEMYSLFCLNFAFCLLNLEKFEEASKCAWAATTIDANAGDEFLNNCSIVITKSELNQGRCFIVPVVEIIKRNSSDFNECLKQTKANIEYKIIHL